MTKAQMGGLDTAFFLIYSIPQFFGGSIGDRYDKKRIIAIAFIIQAFVFMEKQPVYVCNDASGNVII